MATRLRVCNYRVIFGSLVLFTIATIGQCIGTVVERDSEYYSNKISDQQNHTSIEDSRDEIAAGIGADVYDSLVDKLGQNTLDLLTYGAGESNMINLINEVIVCGGTADKIVDLLSQTAASPTKISAETVLGLLNETDKHLRSEPILPHGNDTIGKVANMVCKIDSMDDLVYIVNNVNDWSGGGSPPETDAIERLTVVLALVNENANNMPTIINEIADTSEGRSKLIRLIDEVEDLRNLTTVINEVDVLQNLLTIIELVDIAAPSPNGVDALVTTMNLVTKPEDMAYLVNELATASSNVNNDDWQNNNWATTGPELWSVSGSTAATTNLLDDNQVSTIEIAANIVTTGNITFNVTTSTEAGADYLKFYINDVLQNKWSGSTSAPASFNVNSTGAVRFRWEFAKDDEFSSGSDTVTVSNLVLPGTAGTSRTASEKVAIMLNQLNISAQSTVAEILNDVNTDTYSATGLDNLITIVNEVEYPLNFDDEPRLVTVVNDITAVTTMTALLRDLDDTGVTGIVEIMDHAPDVSQVSDLVNEMDDSGLGSKMTGILNGLETVGALNVAKLVESVDNSNLVTLIDEATSVDHMSTIFNALYLHGSPSHEAVLTSCGYSGGEKMAEVINQVILPSNNLGLSSHLVRLINDIAASPNGPAAVGQIIGGLDPLAENAGGIERMVALLNERNQQNPPLYTDPLSTSATDEFGRIITLVNEMGGDGPANMSRLINEISCNDINNTSNCRVYNMADMVRDTNRITYMSRLISEMTNVELVIELLSDPATNFNKVQVMLNNIGDNSYPGGGVTPSNLYTNPLNWPSVDDDPLGRLIVTINYVAGDQGITNIVNLVNGVDFTDGATDNFSILLTMIENTHRVEYMTRLISDASDLTLVIDLINEIDPANPAEVARLQNLVNDFGDNSYGNSTGIGTTPSPLYGANPSGGSGGQSCNGPACDTNSSDELGRMIVFINDLTTQVIATGSNQSQAIANAVALIIDSYDLNSIMFMLRNTDRIRYVTHLVAQIDNIDLLMTIINGQSGNGSDGVDLNKLLLTLNNYGGSTRRGTNYTTGKAVGEMTMVADIIDILGAGKPLSDQARIITVVNGVTECGIKPQYDRLADENNSEPYVVGTDHFFQCDTNVDFNYDANKNNVAFDQRHRISNLMLGLESASTMATIVGDVTDPEKTVFMMNGIRRINAIIHFANWVPPEVTAKLVNETDKAAIYRSLTYMTNNLAPDEYEAAQAFAAMVHYGTGISGESSTRSDNSKCKYYTGIGPGRLAKIMNIEPGQYLEGIMQGFGWRTSIPAMTCGFGTPNEPEPQTVNGSYGSEQFYRVETVGSFTYQTTGANACHTYNYDCNCGKWSCDECTNYGFMKEKTGVTILLTLDEHTDAIIWSGWYPLGVTAVGAKPGIASVWEALKGEGLTGWLMQNQGFMAFPPVDTSTHGNPSCTDGQYTDEWSCIKHGKDQVPDHLSLHRWGNMCSIAGYNSPGPCEANGGRWMPDKHYDACFVNPATDAPVGQ